MLHSRLGLMTKTAPRVTLTYIWKLISSHTTLIELLQMNFVPGIAPILVGLYVSAGI